MRTTKYSIVAIVSVLLITGFVACSIHATFLTAEDPEKRLLEEHEKVTKNASKPPVIATYGKLPEFENDEQKRNWQGNLKEIGKNVRMRGEMDPYFYPEGTVIGYGHNVEGYTEVTFLEGTVIEKPLMDEIYEIFDRQAREIGIQEVPLIFEFGEIPSENEKPPTE